MASAKNKKKAVAAKKVIKKPAPKKAAKPIVKKSVKKVAVKKVVKKAASVKPAAKVKPKTTAKKVVKPAKKSAPAPKQKVAVKLPAKKVASKLPIKKVVTKVSTQKENSKPTASKILSNIPAKGEKILKPNSPISAPRKNDLQTNLKAKKQEVEKKVVGKSGKPLDAIDPLHAKAAKVMKELEETMDLSKMRPRIQAGTAPKPLLKKSEPLPSLPEPTNTNKEKYTLEFEFRSSPKILFTSLSDSSGLAGWFADEVHVKDKLYTFAWEGGHSNARLVAIRDLHLIRFEWEEDTDGTYFQFEIKEDDITLDVALIITDFAAKGEKDTNIRLWESQVQKLRMLLGSL
jgi:uncharacterized protein YndB with AHSA1/START domain/predicted RNA-binding protein Jag